MTTTTGVVTGQRYRELVREGRALMKQSAQIQFRLGDAALEIEPMRRQDGSQATSAGESRVEEVIRVYSDDIGIPYATLETYRWVASRWPTDRRHPEVSHHIHKILAKRDDRFELIWTPPPLPRTGERRWTIDSAKRQVGQVPQIPETTQEKINRITDLARDDEVATQVAVGLLNRPEVASRTMENPTARHIVNRAQVKQSQQADEIARDRTPAIKRLEHTQYFVELLRACAGFVASVSRVLPTLRGHHFNDKERATIMSNLVRVRATADWLETAVNTDDVSFNEGLAKILRGE